LYFCIITLVTCITVEADVVSHIIDEYNLVVRDQNEHLLKFKN